MQKITNKEEFQNALRNVHETTQELLIALENAQRLTPNFTSFGLGVFEQPRVFENPMARSLSDNPMGRPLYDNPMARPLPDNPTTRPFSDNPMARPLPYHSPTPVTPPRITPYHPQQQTFYGQCLCVNNTNKKKPGEIVLHLKVRVNVTDFGNGIPNISPKSVALIKSNNNQETPLISSQSDINEPEKPLKTKKSKEIESEIEPLLDYEVREKVEEEEILELVDDKGTTEDAEKMKQPE